MCIVLLLSLVAPAMPDELGAESRFDFRAGKIDSSKLAWTATTLDEHRKLDEQGIRLRIDRRGPPATAVGLAPKLRASGNFDVSATYEVVNLDQPEEGSGVGPSLAVYLDSAGLDTASLQRVRRTDGRGFYAVQRGFTTNGSRQTRSQFFRTDADSGKLRIVRMGARVQFLAAEGTSDDFRELAQHEFTTADVDAILLELQTGNATSGEADARWTSLAIRAKSIAVSDDPLAIVGRVKRSSLPSAVSTAPNTSAPAPAAPAIATPATFELLTVQDEKVNAARITLNDRTLTASTDPPRVWPLDEILSVKFLAAASVTEPATLPGAPSGISDAMPVVLRLVGGDVLRGNLIGWNERQVVVKPAWRAEFPVPVEQLVAVSIRRDKTPPAAEAALESRSQRPGNEDVVFARDETSFTEVSGRARGIADGRLRFVFEGAERGLAPDRLIGLVFAARPTRPRRTEMHHVAQFRSDDRLTGLWTGISETAVRWETTWGASIELPRGVIAEINTRNGKLVQISDLDPVRVEEIPYFGRLERYQRDRNLVGQPLKLKGTTYAKGLAVHSRCVLAYELDGRFASFRAILGFDESAGQKGQVAVRLLGDGEVLWENKNLRSSDDPIPLDVPVAGVKLLVLETDYGETEDTCDRVIWANARVVRTDQMP